MISVDTNILLPAVESSHEFHRSAAAFVSGLSDRDDVALSEFVLLELYLLLRTPAVTPKALTGDQAVEICQASRSHPRWQLLGFPSGSRKFHDDYWPRLKGIRFPRRRTIDLRIGLSLVYQGVTDFATVNLVDFKSVGFKRVWNPLTPPAG